jgi:hypothetical protein
MARLISMTFGVHLRLASLRRLNFMLLVAAAAVAVKVRAAVALAVPVTLAHTMSLFLAVSPT